MENEEKARKAIREPRTATVPDSMIDDDVGDTLARYPRLMAALSHVRVSPALRQFAQLYGFHIPGSPAHQERELGVTAIRSRAIAEFCMAAGIKPSDEARCLPQDVKLYRMDAALYAEERRAAVLAEREACAKVADRRAEIPADCEHGHTEWDTNAFVCRLETRGGDCLCAVRAEEAETIATAIRARKEADHG
jgi:hypothetical protein